VCGECAQSGGARALPAPASLPFSPDTPGLNQCLRAKPPVRVLPRCGMKRPAHRHSCSRRSQTGQPPPHHQPHSARNRAQVPDSDLCPHPRTAGTKHPSGALLIATGPGRWARLAHGCVDVRASATPATPSSKPVRSGGCGSQRPRVGRRRACSLRNGREWETTRPASPDRAHGAGREEPAGPPSITVRESCEFVLDGPPEFQELAAFEGPIPTRTSTPSRDRVRTRSISPRRRTEVPW
jgi:hypothetical protein